MLLRDLLGSRMKTERYRPSDLARSLNRSRATVSLTLNRPLEKLQVKTLKSYLEAIGVKVNFARLISNQ